MADSYELFRKELHNLVFSHRVLDAIKYASEYYGIHNFAITDSKTALDNFGTLLYDEFAVDDVDGKLYLLIGRGLLNSYEKLSQEMPERVESRILMAALHEPGHHKPEFCNVMVTRQLLNGTYYTLDGGIQRESQAEVYALAKLSNDVDSNGIKDFLAEANWYNLYSLVCYEAIEAIPELFREEIIRAFIQESCYVFNPWLKPSFVEEMNKQIINRYNSEWKTLPEPDWGGLQSTKSHGDGSVPRAVQNTQTYRRIHATTKQDTWRMQS